MTASGIRSLISRAEIVPDGRGSRRIAMFRRATLDAFLERRAAVYARGRHAVSGVGGTDAKDQIPRRSSALWREVPRAVHGAGFEDRQGEGNQEGDRGSERLGGDGVRMRLMRAAASESHRAERVRLSDYAESWLPTKLPELKASTADKYATMLDLHILPALGDYFIDAIMPADVLKWRDLQDAKPGTVNTRLRVLRTLLADAASDLDLPRNPAQRTHAVRDRRDRDADPNTLSAEQSSRCSVIFASTSPRGIRCSSRWRSRALASVR
jgi:hypothetical protein